MITFTIDARFVRAAQNACATKDTRYYLNGIHLRTDGIIEGTNGHVLYQGKYTDDCQLTEPLIVAIDGKIPVAADSVTFNFEDGASDGQCRTNKGKLFAVKVIDGTFPNTDSVIPSNRDVFSNGMTFDPKYLVKIGQIAGNLADRIGLTMKHGVELESALFTIDGDGADKFLNTFKAVLMPMRGEATFLQSFIPGDRKAA